MRDILCCVVLLLLALVVGVQQDLAYRIAGFRPLRPIVAKELDEPERPDDREAPRFLTERNEIEITVPREMPLGEFLRLYQLRELAHVRRQIAKQEGVPQIDDDHLLRQGHRYKITLTPQAGNVP